MKCEKMAIEMREFIKEEDTIYENQSYKTKKQIKMRF